MAFNDLLQIVGGFGRFQMLYVAVLFIPTLLIACNSFLQNFTAAIPAHRCRISEKDNTFNLSIIAEFIPVDDNLTSSSCTRINGSAFGNWTNATTETCEDGWVYDQSVFTSTIVTQWDLVCNLRTMRQVAQSIYMAGVLVGSILLGSLSDRYGRKFILAGSYLLMGASGTCAAFIPSFVSYCIFRCLCGIAVSGIILNANALALEWTSPTRRTLVGTLFAYCFTFGQIVLPGLAYWITDWRWLQFTVSAPCYIFFLTTLLIPESARWLLLKGRLLQALQDLQKVARINRKKEEAEKLTEEVILTHMQSDLCGAKQSHTPLDLFRTPAMRRITICIMFVWLFTNFAFYGLSMDLESIEMNIFLIQLVFGCVSIPAQFIGAFLLTYVGRRVTQFASLILAGAALLCNAFLSQDFKAARIAMAVLAKGFLSISFSSTYLYSTELFPTVVRQSGMGIASMNGRIGAMVAPLVLMLSEISYSLPSAIYGVGSILSGAATLLLHETLNLRLPETIADVETR